MNIAKRLLRLALAATNMAPSGDSRWKNICYCFGREYKDLFLMELLTAHRTVQTEEL